MKHRIALNLIALWLLISIGSQGVMAQYSDHRNRKVDSLEVVLASPNPPKGEQLLRAYQDLMWGYVNIEGKVAEDYARKALALSYELNALNARADALRMIGMLAYGRGDYEMSLDFYNHALAVTDSMAASKRYIEKDVDDNYSVIYGSIGNLYNIQDQNLLAIEYYQKALPIFEKYGWLESQTILYHNVGELYYTMSNRDEAERNYLLAIECGRKSGDSLMVALPQRGLAKIYLEKDDYENALQTGMESYAYYHPNQKEERGDYMELLSTLAQIHLMDGHKDISKAEAYAEESYRLIREDEDMMASFKSNALSAMYLVAMEKGQWQRAYDLARESVETDPNDTYDDINDFENLAHICIQLGRKDEADLYINKVHDLTKEYANTQYQSALSQMQVIYETEQKQSQIEELQRERTWMHWLTWISVIALLLLVGLLIFLVFWLREKRRHAEAIAKIDGETSERVRIARDLHDRMGALLTGIKLNMQLFTQQPDNIQARENALNLTDEAVHEMRGIVHHLMPESLRRFGLRTAIESFCDTMPLAHFMFQGEDRRLDKHSEEAIYYIAHELVNNAAKNAHATRIDVRLHQNADHTILEVKDNGSGINPHDSGFGMDSIASRVKALGGKLELKSNSGQGSDFIIEVPLR